MPNPGWDQAALQQCHDITKARAKNFYWAIVTLSRPKRKAVYTVYAFARRCDDIADDSGKSVGEKQGRLREEKRRVMEMYKGRRPSDLYKALGTTVEAYSIPEDYFIELIEGVEMDLTKNRYQTFDELKTYCYRVASVVGLITLEIFQYSDDEAKEYAIDLGIGMQLTNIIRDISEDLSRDRIYLPLEDLERFDYLVKDLRNRVLDERFTSLLEYEAQRARDFFRSGRKLFPYLPLRARACPAGLYGIYSKLLSKMEDSNWDVLEDRARLSTLSKISAVIRQWLLAVV